jgi:hypothetical protein
MRPEDISPDFVEWPERWMCIREDVAYGRGLLPPMHAFVVYLISKGLTKKTIRRHIDNLWLLGGEIISNVSNFNEYDTPPIQKLRESIGSGGGPYCRHIDAEAELASFDSTCRELHRFLEAEQVKKLTTRSTGRAKKLRPG